MTPGWCLDHSDLQGLSALGGTRTPNLLIRRRSRRVQRVCSRWVQSAQQEVREPCRPLSPPYLARVAPRISKALAPTLFVLCNCPCRPGLEQGAPHDRVG